MQRAKILVVEDDPDSMEILTQTLRSAGYEVVSAYGGEDALRKLAAQQFDLVVTDLAMPRVTGVDVIHAVKANSGTPVVAVTAYMWDGIANAAGQEGCDGYIAKPIRPKELVKELQKYLTVPTPGSRRQSVPPVPTARILVVEDDPDNMDIITRVLRGVGHEVVHAYGGEDALRKVATQKFDLVLTDLAMPKVSGVEVIHAVKTGALTQDVPVIAVTAHVGDELAQAAMDTGCDGYVSKPFSTRQLIHEVQRHLKPRKA